MRPERTAALIRAALFPSMVPPDAVA